MHNPWGSLAPANLTFCEAALPGWIAEPANTWSNVGFVVVAIILALRRGDRVARALAIVALFTGISSALFHASRTFAGQALDQSVMFMESALFVVWNLRRARSSRRDDRALYLALVVIPVLLLLTLETVGILLFTLEIATFLALELRLALRDQQRARYGGLLAAGACFALSYALWWLDRTGILCDPENHVFGGHAAWHLLGALSFWLWHRHFGQFRAVLYPEPPIPREPPLG